MLLNRRSRHKPFEDNRRIVASEPKRVQEGGANRALLDRAAYTSQVAGWIRIIIVRRGMDLPGVNRKRRGYSANGSRCA